MLSDDIFLPENTEWFIEDQAFCRRVTWLLSHPPASKLDWQNIERLRKRENLLTWEGEGVGEAKS